MSKITKSSDLPILYSLRHCPYAMRARMAFFKAKLPVLLRDIKLDNKPEEMLLASPKGEVPVLQLPNGKIIDESIDIAYWALTQQDPSDLLIKIKPEKTAEMKAFVAEFDLHFKPLLEAYRCAKRYHENNLETCRAECEVYLQRLEIRLTASDYLFSSQESIADILLMPYLRQFAQVERQWYLAAPYPKLRDWLNRYLQSPMFTKVMAKREMWLVARQDVIFGV